MRLTLKQHIIYIRLIVTFLYVSSYSIINNNTLNTWPPSILLTDDLIQIRNCPNLVAIPAFAAAGRTILIYIWVDVNGISQIDEAWIENSTNIKGISLYGNKLTSIPPFNCGAAGTEGCPELKAIRLENNLITNIPSRSFANLPKLDNLKLQKNCITTLANLWIVDCPLVKAIHIYDNANLTRFLITNGLENRGLANLKFLYLFNCNISSLDPDFLLLFPNLTDFRIYNNPIKTFPHFVASHSVKIETYWMNNVVCDCNAIKLAQNGMINSQNQVAFCGRPNYNVGKNFTQLKCEETAVSRAPATGCGDVSGDQWSSRERRLSVEFLQSVPAGVSDVFLRRSDSFDCPAVSILVHVSGSPDKRATYRICPIVGLSSLTCRFQCTCPFTGCNVYVK